MKLSIWQQFSSNHSASFTVVGQFETIEQANTAAEELRKLIREIGAWREAHPDTHPYDLEPLTPPEEAARERFGIPWCINPSTGEPVSIDWIYRQADVNMVGSFEKCVIVSNDADTSIGHVPFDALIRVLGGIPFIEGELSDQMLAIRLTCTTPNEEKASWIVRELKSSPQAYEPDKMLTLPQLSPVYGAVHTESSRLVFDYFQLGALLIPDGKTFSEAEPILIEQQLERLMKYLTEHGCTEITYHFIEKPWSDVEV